MKYRIFSVAIILIVVAAATVSCFHSSTNSEGNAMPDLVSYNFNIRPILSDKCFNCHGPDANKRQAGLRLDIASEAYKALQDHPHAHALVPGDPSASELFLRVSSKDSAIQMPPASSHLPGLSDD